MGLGASGVGAGVTPYYDEDGITIYHGDCREVLPSLGGIHPDALVTDPPYGVNFREYASHDDDPALYAETLRGVWLAEERVLRGWCVIYQSAVRARDWARTFDREWRLIALPKTFVQIPGGRGFYPYHSTDYALAWPIQDPDWPPKRGAPRDWFLCETSDMSQRPEGHPCPRPLNALLFLVGCFSLPGQTVLDPFMGSGTTLVTAKNLGRRAIGIEIEERYCEIAAKRLAQRVLFGNDASDGGRRGRAGVGA